MILRFSYSNLMDSKAMTSCPNESGAVPCSQVSVSSNSSICMILKSLLTEMADSGSYRE
jgi:hypothetical protein